MSLVDEHISTTENRDPLGYDLKRTKGMPGIQNAEPCAP